MMLVFVLIAGTLAAGAAALLLLPLVKRREDNRPVSTLAAVGVLFALLLGGAGLYAAFSNYSWVDAPAVADTPAAMTAKLAKRLAEQPDDLDGWLKLGRSYQVLEQWPLSVRAYQRADRLANGQNVDAILGVAESLFAQDQDALRGAAGKLFERALELDPHNAKALFYSAFAALGRGELPLARERLSRMLAQNPPPQIREILEKSIANIDQQVASAGQPAAGGSAAGSKATPGSDNAKVTVHVSLSPKLKVPADAVLFVAAREPKSPGPPFAVKRLPATFPVDVELGAADAMIESRRITAGQTLEVVARVALGGTPTATRGDPFGQVSYHVGKDGRLNIVIDRLAP
ncbi:MAG TPA: tetratricopeptide repeat protein [Steroidobacteraceae bacterium]|nr:tetratricopeptide repeat protein [Steroidobacteraceae bacterium]